MKENQISCVIPVFNGERYLGETIDSALAQTAPLQEIIVVDDGSTDRTREVVTEYGDSVKYLHQQNAGPAAARNKGIENAAGNFICFLDADDLWAPDKTERQLEVFATKPETDVCVCKLQNFWIPELKEEQERFAGHRISQPVTAYLTQAMLARREVFDRVGLLDADNKHGDSAEWFLRARGEKIHTEVIPEVLVRRRIHRDNRSRVLADESRDEFLSIVKASLDRRRSKS